MVPAADTVDAAAAALSHLASSSTAPDAQAVVNAHTDTFTQALKVCAPRRTRASRTRAKKPRALLTGRKCLFVQETHVRLRDEIDRGHDPSPYSHTVQASRAKSQLVGLRASLMAAHLSAMLQRLDDGGAPS